ncbi:MAG: twin-arginine translocase subunit TatB [Brevundimonas sp.]|nr:MAG: twin-arginine translocase subunit TatB [Brevundimonas sp.]
MGPGIGGMEYVVIAVVALLVVGPERLPAMLHKLGKLVARARNMANEFRHSFDEMARQSELDDLRKEVEALRTSQTNMMPLGADAEATFRSISDDLNRPVTTTAAPAPALTGPDEWPDTPPVMAPLDEPEVKPAAKPRAPRKATPTAAKPVAAKAASAKAPAKKPAAKASAKSAKTAPDAPKPAPKKTTRKKAADQ